MKESVVVVKKGWRIPVLGILTTALFALGCEEPVSFEEIKEFQFGYETLQKWFYDQLRVPSEPYDHDSLTDIYNQVNDRGTYYLSTAPSDSILEDTDTVPSAPSIPGRDLGVLLDSAASGYVVTGVLRGSAVGSPDTNVKVFSIRDTFECLSADTLVIRDTLEFSTFDTLIFRDTIVCASAGSLVFRDTLIRDTTVEIIEQGDTITAIDTVTLRGQPSDVVGKLISQSSGSSKRVFFTEVGGRKAFIDVTLRSYPPKTVFRKKISNGTHYIRVTAITNDSQDSSGTSGEMENALREVADNDVVILDLRDLSGKNIIEALDIAEVFPRGGDHQTVKYRRRFHDGRLGAVITERKTTVGFVSSAQGPAEIRIRINERTRVAAEALCWGIRSGQSVPVTILGTRSVDHGSYRKQIRTPEGGLCSVTYSRVSLPDGSTWGNGIEPDTETDFAGEIYDSIPDLRFGFR